jgi:hypothetical protein
MIYEAHGMYMESMDVEEGEAGKPLACLAT